MDTGTITDILNRTAWRMDTPQLFGSFHIAASLFTAVAAVLAAVFFARRAVIEKNVRRALVFTGSHGSSELVVWTTAVTTRRGFVISCLA